MSAPERIFPLNDNLLSSGPVIYWMQRDQRVNDNPALIYAQEKAMELKQPLLVAFCLAPSFLDATGVQYRFMLDGLIQVSRDLNSLNIAFTLLKGKPEDIIRRLIDIIDCGLLVTDFNPLRIVRQWKDQVNTGIRIPFHEVDAHNIIPARFISAKEEYSAYTLRRKTRKSLDCFLHEMPVVKRHPHSFDKAVLSDERLLQLLESPENRKRAVIPSQDISWIKPGEASAVKALGLFIENRLDTYTLLRNDPNIEAQSGLSPYLHFGQLSSQRVAMEVIKSAASPLSKEAFLEELVVRKELSDNFCLYNAHSDSFEGFPSWARKTLNAHRYDPRPFLYDLEVFEEGRTHDPLWNAAQNQMLRSGKMHGYMRMYWAKKILEWTASPEEAMAVAVYLNDKYQLDGRDPNGYAGIAWSIGGVHDRPWSERPVFGMVRYMNFNGCKRKFDIAKYTGLDLTGIS